MTLELTVEIDGPTAKRLQQIAEESRLPDGDPATLEDVAADALAQWSEGTLQQLALAEGDGGRPAEPERARVESAAERTEPAGEHREPAGERAATADDDE